MAVGRSILAALRPGPNRLAVAPALRAFGVTAVIAVSGAVLGDLEAVGIAFFGAACSAAFAAGGAVYRAGAMALLAQAAGAVTGLVIGVLVPSTAAWFICVAAAFGVASGVIGAVGPNTPALGLMMSVGLAFGQFGRPSGPWWQAALWYLVGTAAVTVAMLPPWLLRRDSSRRRAIGAVLFAAADLCAAIGTEGAPSARARLTAASAIGRMAAHHPRADLVAFAAAALYAQGQPPPETVAAAIRAAAVQIQFGRPVLVDAPDPNGNPALQAMADALSPEPVRPGAPLPARRRAASLLRATLTQTAMANGARIGLCMGVATGLAVALREPGHAFWLPMTVAVIVRPEYASVFVRTVNRVAGTVIGAALAAATLALQPGPVAVAVAAAVALCAAVLTAPKLYAYSVIGVTASALLASALGHVDPALAGLRLLDTLIGASVALVFGYLLWPGARRLPATARLDAAVPAARRYLDQAQLPPDQRSRWQARRDDAYRLAHQVRAGAESALTEPPPLNTAAIAMVPAAMRLEHLVDAITAVAAAIDAGHYPTPLINDIRQQLAGALGV
jgi:Fusaric acid resistance protein-like